MWYFKKFDPSRKVVIAGNVGIQFTSVDGGMTGWFATQEQSVADQMRQFIHQQRYGLTEVSADEFTTEYVDKKKVGTPLPTHYSREQIGKGGYEPPRGLMPDPDKLAKAAAAVKSDIVANTRIDDPLPNTPSIVKEKPPEVVPNVGKRVNRKNLKVKE